MPIFETLLILWFLVFVHELGHFVVAKVMGLGKLTFCIGLGPKLFSFCCKKTTVVFALIPFGGWCQLNEDEYQAKEKLMVALGGPLFSLVLAMALWLAQPSFNGVVLAFAMLVFNLLPFPYFDGFYIIQYYKELKSRSFVKEK